MKKITLSLLLMFIATLSVNAQMLRAEELEKYAKEKYGDKWVEAAENIKSQITLDKNNSIVYTQVIDCTGKTKEQLYVLLNYWYTNTFNDSKSVIKLNDKDLGCIIGDGFISGVAAHSGGTNTYVVNLRTIIKTDIKDGKVRVVYSIPSYDVDIQAGGGILGVMSGTTGTHVDETWSIEKCFPFAEKDGHKKTSAKALVMAHAYSNIIMDKIEEALKNGINGNEDSNW
jgi:hypothetical protein